MPQTRTPPPPLHAPGRASSSFGLKHRVLLSLLLLGIIGVVAFFLRDASRPLGLRQSKGIVAAALCVLLLAAMWIPPFGRILLRLFGR